MSFFNAQPGKRPVDVSATPDPVVSDGLPAATPHFTTSLGARPQCAAPGMLPAETLELMTAESRALRCPLCRSALTELHCVWLCTGRCGARWLEALPGQLVDLAALPYGICRCCERPQALVRVEQRLICPVSGSDHLLLPDGAHLLDQAAPNGLCSCCAPPAPLIWHAGVLICQAKPGNHYQRVGEQVRPIPVVAASGEATLAAIDQALRRNNAHVLTHGLFDLDF